MGSEWDFAVDTGAKRLEEISAVAKRLWLTDLQLQRGL